MMRLSRRVAPSPSSSSLSSGSTLHGGGTRSRIGVHEEETAADEVGIGRGFATLEQLAALQLEGELARRVATVAAPVAGRGVRALDIVADHSGERGRGAADGMIPRQLHLRTAEEFGCSDCRGRQALAPPR